MATYYVRQTGNDSNAGTSPATAWRTLGYALTKTVSGPVGGDTIWVGAGEYRESITVTISPASELLVLGDPTGANTGDAGEVFLTGMTAGNHYGGVTNTGIALNGKSNITLRNFTFCHGAASGNFPITFSGAETNIKVQKCAFYAGKRDNNSIRMIVNAGVIANHLVEDCIFVNFGHWAIYIELARAASVDYNTGIQINRCQFFNGINDGAIFITSSGASGTGEGGGITIRQCWLHAGNQSLVKTSGTNVGGATFAYPVTVYDCGSTLSSTLNAAELGAIVDGGGNISSNNNTNVTRHPSSYDTYNTPQPGTIQFLSLGHQWIHGLPILPLGTPLLSGGWKGLQGGGTVDQAGLTPTEGRYLVTDTGTASAGAATTLTDSSKSWPVNAHVGRMVRITGGTGSGQVKYIISNTATALTISGATGGSGNWATNPDNTSTYTIYEGPPAQTGKATATATTTTLTDGNASWQVGRWNGYTVSITGGTNAGTTRTVTSNTATTLTVTSAWAAATDATSVYELYQTGGTDSTWGNTGPLALHNTATKETSVTDSGNAIRIDGPGSHEFQIPVDATSTTISIKARYNANHGTTNKPQVILVAEGQIGVSTETKTMTAAADTWETLTFTAFTPSANGVVTIRVVSRSAKPFGSAYFDTVTVT